MLSAGAHVVNTFGGLTGTAKALEAVTGEKVPVSTVQGWKKRGTIPQAHWRALIKASADIGKPLSLGDFLTEHDDPKEKTGALSRSSAA